MSRQLPEYLEKRVLAFYGRLLQEYGLGVREITDVRENFAEIGHIGIRTVVRYLDHLEDMGLLQHIPGKVSSYRVLMNDPDNKMK